MEATYASAIYGAVALFLLFYYYLLTKSSKHKLPPEAPGARHLHLMAGGATSSAKPPHIILGALSDQHGPIFTLRLGVRRILLVSSSRIAKELFTSSDLAISSRPKTRGIKHLGYDFVMFAFSPYSAYWRHMRKLVTVELLSSHRAELFSSVGMEEVKQSVKELHAVWEGKKDGSGQLLVDMRNWLADMNLNTILRQVVGKRLCGGGGGDDAEEMRQCRDAIWDFFHLVGLFVPADALPWLGWLDLGGYEKKMKETAKKLEGIMGGWLEEHRRKEYSGGEGKVEDFMDVILSAVRGSEGEYEHDVDTVIKSTCQLMILGATDTFAVTLTWALSLLLNNRHVLTKAQEELDKHVGRHKGVNKSDICNLVYLQAIVKETLRLYPAAPLGGPREFREDCNIAGYHIPKGTWLMVNVWKLHRDPQVWQDNPLDFKPERFLTTHKNMDINGQDFELMPFGGGRRICPGLNLGMQTINMVLANLLQAFEFVTINNEAVDMTESAGLTNLKATPLEILITPRLPPNLY
uniref:Flavonoid-6-hydroxylase n=1 Tax=Strobilanthes cusia TaxID=222567 RepID=A0A3G2C0R1_9LAMI|nr:cytochrome P450 [Strobilanthes cusia]